MTGEAETGEAVTGEEGDKRLARFLDAVLGVASDLSLPVVLRRIVTAAAALADARYAALGVIGPDGRLAEFITVGARPQTVEAIGDPPEGRGILGLLIVEARPIRLAHVAEHPDSYGFPPNHPRMRSFLGVPLRVRGEVFGNLYLAEKKGDGDFTAEDKELVVALAAASGVAVENARLHARVRELAVIEDRERIARDLHDTVIQRLFATGMALQAAGRLSTDQPDLTQRLDQAVTDLDATIEDVRSTIFALQEPGRGQGGIRADVSDLVREAANSLGFQPRVHFDGPVDAAVPEEIADHLLATLREVLANVSRHAAATHVEVHVEAGDDVVLRVADDGIGVSPTPRPGGQGLRNMADRAEALSGTLELHGGPEGRGTEVVWRIPLDGAIAHRYRICSRPDQEGPTSLRFGPPALPPTCPRPPRSKAWLWEQEYRASVTMRTAWAGRRYGARSLPSS